MRSSTHRAIRHERLVSSGTGDVQTFTFPPSTSAIEMSVETTSARYTTDGSDPSVANAPSHVFPFGQVPVFRPYGPGTVLKFVSTTGTPSVMQLSYYT